MSKRNILSTKQMFSLVTYTKAHYAARSVTDIEFAAQATADLGFHILPSNISTAREVHDIPSTKMLKRMEPDDTETRLQRLEVRVGHLTNCLSELYRRLGEAPKEI